MSPEPEKIGRYEVGYVIGRGSMGVVYLAVDPLLKRSVAVKIMRGKSGNASETIERFKREAEISAKLNHPNIITVYDVGVDPEMGPFLTMEYITGASLAQVIKLNLPVDEVMKLLLQGMSALQAAQLAGIVHRDVKPENMLVSQTGHLKLMDFGIARGDQSRLTAEGVMFGTPTYIAPELLTGGSPSPATDRYAFAVTAFEALTGALPYQGSSVGSTLYRIVHEPPAIPPDLAPELQAVFLRALSKDPAARYPDLPEFMEALINAAPLDREPRAKLLDSLDVANTNTSNFNFLPITSDNLPAIATPGPDSDASASTSQSDPRSGGVDPDPPTYPLHLESIPGSRSASTLALAEPSISPPNVETREFLPRIGTDLPENQGPSFPKSTPSPTPQVLRPVPSGKPGKGGHGLRWAALTILLMGGLGVGGYFFRGPKQIARTIKVLSEPAGAAVYLEGQKIGETPLDHVEVRAGVSMLRVKMAGYLSQSYRLREGENSVKVVMKRPPRVVAVVTDPPGATVFLNGNPMGVSPIQNLGIPAEGSSQLKITHDGYTPWETEVDANFPFPDLIRLTPLPKARH